MTWLRLVPWRLVGLAVLLACLVYAIGAYGDKRAAKEHAKVQALWDQDRAAYKAASDKAVTDALLQKTVILSNNAKVIEDANAQLVAIAADRDSLAVRVRDYQDSLRASAAREATGDRGLDVAARIARGAAELDAAYDAYDKSCQRDAVRFRALQDEIRPQIQ